MSNFLLIIRDLIEKGDYLITDHAFRELAEEEIAFIEIKDKLHKGIVVEEYPNYFKGPAILILTTSDHGGAVHSLWGIPKGEFRPATLITAYLPDPARWESDNLTRRRK